MHMTSTLATPYNAGTASPGLWGFNWCLSSLLWHLFRHKASTGCSSTTVTEVNERHGVSIELPLPFAAVFKRDENCCNNTSVHIVCHCSVSWLNVQCFDRFCQPFVQHCAASTYDCTAWIKFDVNADSQTAGRTDIRASWNMKALALRSSISISGQAMCDTLSNARPNVNTATAEKLIH